MAIRIVPYQAGLPRLLHHVALCPKDITESIHFYRDGIGLSILVDHEFPGPYQRLLNLPCERLRSIFLGDPEHPHAGIVELVTFDEPSSPEQRERRYDHFWLSFWVDVRATIRRLDELSLADNLQVMELEDGAILATIDDPDGVKIELIPNSMESKNR